MDVWKKLRKCEWRKYENPWLKSRVELSAGRGGPRRVGLKRMSVCVQSLV